MTLPPPPHEQRHHHPVPGGIGVWHVPRLWELAADLPVRDVPLSAFERELDSVYWFDDDHPPTVRAVLVHAQLVRDVDMSWPVIVSEAGWVMDGMHRIARAVLDGQDTIRAVRFDEDPPPDEVLPTPEARR